MAARVIDGKAVAAAVRERVKVDVAAYAEETGRVPGLATVLVGEDPASKVYVRMKRRNSRGGRDALGPPRAGRRRSARRSCSTWSRELNEDDEVDGILVQLPLPAQIDENAIVAAIDPAQGRRRPDPGQRRPARPRRRRAWCPARRPG